MDREKAYGLMQEYIKDDNLRKHSLAVEAVMRKLAAKFAEDEDLWGLAGLLHDIDYEETKEDPAKHSIVGSEMLEKMGLPAELVYAVKVHNDYHGFPRENNIDKALFCIDPLTGLITAAALVRPDKKIASVKTKSIKKKFKDNAFARGANRETIKSCSELGLSLEEFFDLALEAMQEVSGELGL